jgi:hypothetical protein
MVGVQAVRDNDHDDSRFSSPIGWPEGAPWIAAEFEDARRFRLRLSLRASPAERLRDLESMLEFSTRAEELNPRLRAVAERLRAVRSRVSHNSGT